MISIGLYKISSLVIPLQRSIVRRYSISMYSRGDVVKAVDMVAFATNRERLTDELRKVKPKSFVLLKGGNGISHYNTDIEYNFVQEPYFHWAFGVREPDFYGGLNICTGESFLFIPRLEEEYEIWLGKLPTPADVKNSYNVSKVFYVDEMEHIINNQKPESLLTLSGLNTDSKLQMEQLKIPFCHNFVVDHEILHEVMTELRVIKTNYEIELIKEANNISSQAHRYVMQKANLPNLHEFQAESLFLHYCYYVGGCRTTAYTCICGSGHNASVLHYGHAAAPNDKKIKDGDMCLFDMGASFYGYASDITVSFPANGKFTEDQAIIYNAVLAARNRALELAKPGASWSDIHLEANKAMFKSMKCSGLLQGDVDKMIEAELAAIFQPHGLGHLMGIDVHDVGGYTSFTPPRPERPSLRNLRTARTLKHKMVLTIEPGCYFIDPLLNKALSDPIQSKFINADQIKRFRGFGGVRIEDNIVVTEDGCKNLTDVPRTVEEIETWMASDDMKAIPDIKFSMQ